ncbi:Cubilinlike, partial [Caligus rogercresseyi]
LGTRIELTINDLDLKSSENCQDESLSVYGGPDETSPRLTQQCSRMTRKLFKAQFIAKTDGCGGRVSAPSGAIHSPNYPNSYDKEDDCAWSIETDPAIYDGDSLNAPLVLRYCNQSVPSPMNNFISSGNKMYVRLKAGGSATAKGFKANYSRTCGVIEINFSKLSTSLDSARKLLLDHRRINFVHMDIFDVNARGNQGNCSNTRIEVRDGLFPDSPLIATFCSPQYLLNYLPEGFGFRGIYSKENSACGGELTSGRGRISSPNYPDPYPINVECVWTLGGWPGNRVRFQLINFNIEESEGCNKDYLELHENGPSDIPTNFTFSSKLWIKFNSDSSTTGNGFIAEFSLCKSYDDDTLTWRIIVEEGNKIQLWFVFQDVTIGEDNYCFIWQLWSMAAKADSDTGNVAYITFHVDAADQRRGSKFLLSWREVPRTSFALNINTTTRINNTNYPTYENNENCIWILQSLPETRIKLVITDQTITATMIRLVSMTVYMELSNGPERVATFVVDIPLQAGALESPTYPHEYPRGLDCTWKISVREGAKIQVVFEDLDIHASDSSCSNNDYLELRNGGTSQNGRICGSTIPSTFNTSSNHLTVTLKTALGHGPRGHGFKLHYRELSLSCGELFFIESDREEYIFTSPNYPNSPPNPSECFWGITTLPGKRIQLDFQITSIFDHGKVFDGMSEESNALGTFCRDKPATLFSTNYMLYVRYYTFNSSPNGGFKARAKMVDCPFWIMRTNINKYIFFYSEMWRHSLSKFDHLTISSPDYPHNYDKNLDCEWNIIAPVGHSMVITFIEFDLPHFGNCSEGDYLSIIDHERSFEVAQIIHLGLLISLAMNLGTFCGREPLPPVSTLGTTPPSFSRLNPSIIVERCLRKSGERTSGIIESPGYPNGILNYRRCTWGIVAPPGHIITFRFLDVDLINDCNRTFLTDSIGTLMFKYDHKCGRR